MISPYISSDVLAQRELGRFLSLATLQGKTIEMFSPIIDAEWHKLISSGEYENFCKLHSIPPLGHDKENASKVPLPIDWCTSYELLHGELPEIWFRKLDNTIDVKMRDSYRKEGFIRASWDCGPVRPEPMDKIPKDDLFIPKNDIDKLIEQKPDTGLDRIKDLTKDLGGENQ